MNRKDLEGVFDFDWIGLLIAGVVIALLFTGFECSISINSESAEAETEEPAE